MKKQKKLIIFKGNHSIILPEKYNGLPIYVLGAGKVDNLNLKIINDHDELNNYAERYRDKYCDWIYSINKLFLRNKLVFENISLFFFTDLFAKRTELFNTYKYFINYKIIEAYIKKNRINHICLISDDKDFSDIMGNLKNISIELLSNHHKKKLKFLSIKTTMYFLKILFISLSNIYSNKNNKKKTSENIFLSRYPLHFKPKKGKLDQEDKFTDKIKKHDKYAVSIITDGFHQNISIYEYFKFKKRISNQKFYLIDNQIKLLDVIKLTPLIIKIIFKWKKIYNEEFTFLNVKLNKLIVAELKFSLHRVIRMLVLYRSLDRFLKKAEIKTFYYYLHEYPYGRMITSLLIKKSIKHVALQHGPSSYRKLVYFLSKSDQAKVDLTKFSPKPEHVLAEEKFSKKIYELSNYKRVDVMDKIYRLNYLKSLKRKQQKYNLIAPGLHDGQLLLSYVEDLIKRKPKEIFIIKPHPRANNRYLKNINLQNLTISNVPIYELYKNAKKIICSYSSAGYEGKLLGIKVDLVKIPGVIDESPLFDRGFNLRNINL